MSEPVEPPASALQAWAVPGANFCIIIGWRYEAPTDGAGKHGAATTRAQTSVQYNVQLREGGSSSWQKVATAYSNETSVTSKPLSPGGVYDVRVTEVISVSQKESLQSTPIRLHVRSRIPGSPPSNWRSVEALEDRIVVGWGPPERVDGKLLGYKLYWCEAREDSDSGAEPDQAYNYFEVRLGKDATTFAAENLVPGQDYRFQILAYTSGGDGPHTDILRCTADLPMMRRRSSWATTPHRKLDPVFEDGSITGRVQPQIPAAYGATPSVQIPKPKAVFTLTRAQPAASMPRAVKVRQPAPQRKSMDAFWQKSLAGLSLGADGDGLGETETDEGAEATPPPGSNPNVVGFGHYSGSYNPFKGSGFNDNFGTTGDPEAAIRPPKASLKEVWFTDGTATADSGRPGEFYDAKPLTRGVSVGKSSAARGRAQAPMAFQGLLMSGKGTIRGKTKGVRATLQVISSAPVAAESELLKRLYQQERNQSIVIYTTTLEAVRDTVSRCQQVLKLFEILRLKVQVKDLHLCPRFAEELEERAPGTSVPQVFVSFSHIGGATEIEQLNDTGQIRQLCEGYEERSAVPCGSCGGVGYVICQWCQGSKKSREHPFTKGAVPGSNYLLCSVCNENGLQKCRNC